MNSTPPKPLSPERRRELGNSRGGRATGHKGLAAASPEVRAAVRAKALAARRRKAQERAQKRQEVFPIYSRSKVS